MLLYGHYALSGKEWSHATRRARWFCLVWIVCLFLLGGIAPARAEAPDTQLLFGNPSGAVADPVYEDNYLIERTQYALAYRRADGVPRWVSWHLAAEDIGSAPRCDCFTSGTSLPAGAYAPARVTTATRVIAIHIPNDTSSAQ
jgi:DNA/RNA endonuclease G (NUC1)